MTDVFDVAVVGSGPSGLTAAIRLRQMGRSVVVLHRPRQRPSRVEALTPGVADILRYLSADGVLTEAGATPVQRHRVAWTTREPVERELQPSEASFLVRRHNFDEGLERLARAQGVVFHPSSRTIAIESKGEQQLITYAHGGLERVVTARHVLEATGRAHGEKCKKIAAPLVALCASFDASEGDGCEMLVEALADGWLWAARLPDGALHVTAFADPVHVHLRWPGKPEVALAAMLAMSTHLPQRRDAGTFDGACDAGSYVSEDWLRDGHWKIGDSALGLDPLSSSGVEKSMRFALQAALAVNTVLLSERSVDVANEFLTGKLTDAYARHLTWTGEHYAAAWRWPEEPFWLARGAARSAIQNETGQVDQRKMSVTLLGAPRIAAGVVLKSVPCALEDHIERRGAVVHPSLGEPVAFVEGVELAPLLRAGVGAVSYPDLIERWSRVLPRERAIRICAWALQKGILISEGAAVEPGSAPQLASIVNY